jgi:hypothetical protein
VMDPNGKRLPGAGDLPQLSDEELEHRIGASTAPATRVRRPPRASARAMRPPERGRYEGADRRRILWRDSATILIGVVLALLGARFLIPSGPATAVGSPTAPADTGLVAVASPTDAPTGSSSTPAPSATPIPTGVVVPTGLHLDATPTPIPVITLPPATPRPSPSASLKPGQTPAPSTKPGASPTPKPIQGAPVVSVTCTVATLSFIADCTSVGSANVAGATYLWDFGDGSAPIAGGTTKQHTYTAGQYVVTLTITNATGSGHDEANVQIPGL